MATYHSGFQPELDKNEASQLEGTLQFVIEEMIYCRCSEMENN